MKAEETSPSWVQTLARVFEKAGYPLYMVGGAVRNPLMGLPVSDMDLCGPALPHEVCQLCQGTKVRALLRAAHFGTVELHVEDGRGRHMAEYTTFREDSYRCGHRPEAVTFTKDLAVDALRRDFSVNALYQRCLTKGLGEVEDPTGGLAHLRQGVLRTVTENPDQVLKDDGLRILRAARFQAELGLQPTESLLASARRHAALLSQIAPERLHDELVKVLLADFRYPMLARVRPATGSGLETIVRVEAWPFLFAKLHFDDEAAKALACLRSNEGLQPVAARLALLLWQEEAASVRRALHVLRFSVKEQRQVTALLPVLQQAAEGGIPVFDAVRAGLPVLQFAENALEALGRWNAKERLASVRKKLQDENVPFSLRELAVGGDDLLPLCRRQGLPDNCLGSLLERLWQAVAQGELPNQRGALLAGAQPWLEAEKIRQRRAL